MEKNVVTLEGTKLKRIADQNDTSMSIFLSLADRKRFRSVTDISHMKNLLIKSGERIVLDDYMKTWKELETLGVGSIVYGRNGKSHRFKWNYSLKSVGKAGMNGKDVQVRALKAAAPIKRTQPVQVKEDAPKPIKAPQPKPTRQHTNNVLYIPLRPNFAIDMEIPNDITSDEIQAIQTALKRFA